MSKSKVLIVDDEVALLDVLHMCIGSSDSEVLRAKSGNEAIEMIKLHNIGLIISDYSMPNGDGLSLFKYVKDNHQNINFYFFTATDLSALKQETLLRGVFCKPTGLLDVVKVAQDHGTEHSVELCLAS